MKNLDRISYIMFAASFVAVCINTECKHEQPQANQSEQSVKGQYDSIAAAQYYSNYNAVDTLATNRRLGRYHYEVTISGTQFHGKRYRHRKYDTNLINGKYIWNMDIYLATEQEWYDYIIDHLEEMQKYKVTNSSPSYSDELEYYDEHFDDYYDDPEDGITYPDDIFDYLQD